MIEQPLNRKMIEAMNALVDADERLAHANNACRKANIDQCAALNKANEAQKAFDAVAAEIRKLAIPGTDWKSLKGGQHD